MRVPGDDPEPVFEEAPSFTRSSSAGSTSVPSLPVGYTTGTDLFAPSKIVDLLASLTSVENLTVVLTWTAPGDDLDSGTGKDRAVVTPPPPHTNILRGYI